MVLHETAFDLFGCGSAGLEGRKGLFVQSWLIENTPKALANFSPGLER
jgi:hypothetical protein